MYLGETGARKRAAFRAWKRAGAQRRLVPRRAPLRVVRVVAVPTRDGCASHGAAEGGRRAREAHGREVAAVRPPHDADAGGVGEAV